jgi:hypothetical protein
MIIGLAQFGSTSLKAITDLRMESVGREQLSYPMEDNQLPPNTFATVYSKRPPGMWGKALISWVGPMG